MIFTKFSLTIVISDNRKCRRSIIPDQLIRRHCRTDLLRRHHYRRRPDLWEEILTSLVRPSTERIAESRHIFFPSIRTAGNKRRNMSYFDVCR